MNDREETWKENYGIQWLVIGVFVGLLNMALLGRWEFFYAIPYAEGFIGLGAILIRKEAGMVGSASVAFLGMLSVLVSTGMIDPFTVSLAGVVLLVLAALNIGPKTSVAKYLTLAALGAWTVWAFVYFIDRIQYGLPIPFETLLYHGGVFGLSGFDFVTMLGHWKGRGTFVVRTAFAIAIIIGAIMLVGLRHWGLQAMPIP